MRSRLLILTLFSLLFTGTFNVFGQHKVSVVIAKRDNNCGHSVDLGYAWYSSATNSATDLKKKAKSDVTSAFSDYETTESISEYNGCSYMVIISTRGKDSDGCATNHYGVGFADDRTSALEKAKKNLTGRDWHWSESRDGFTVAEEKHF